MVGEISFHLARSIYGIFTGYLHLVKYAMHGSYGIGQNANGNLVVHVNFFSLISQGRRSSSGRFKVFFFKVGGQYESHFFARKKIMYLWYVLVVHMCCPRIQYGFCSILVCLNLICWGMHNMYFLFA